MDRRSYRISLDMKKINGHIGYFVTKDGEFYSQRIKRWGYRASNQVKKLKTVINNHGYRVVRMDGKIRKVCQLVLETFQSRRPSKNYQVRHLDGNKLNDSLKNLSWGTAKENALDRDNHGMTCKGSKQKSSKLSKEDIPIIRELISKNVPQRSIAKRFGVSQRTICFINTGQHWSHV